MASPQSFSQEAQGQDTWGSDQLGTCVGRAWIVNEEVSEGAALEAGHPSSSLIPFWISQSWGHCPAGLG